MSEGNGKPNSNPFSKSVPVALSTHVLGVNRQVTIARENAGSYDEDDFTAGVVDTNHDLVTVNKKILECQEYKAVTGHLSAVRSYLRSKQVPGGGMLFKSSTYPIPLRMYKEVDDELRKMGGEFKRLVAAFLAVYPQRAEETKRRLQSQKVLGREYDLSDDDDYPPVDQVAKQFYLFHNWVQIGPAEVLSGVDPEAYEEERKRFGELATTAAAQVEAALYAKMQEFLDHLVSRLRPSKDGKKKTFNADTLKNIKEFLNYLPDFNVTGSKELEALGDRCRAVVDGMDPELLKNSEATRKVTAAKLDQIKKAVDKSIVDAPKRFVSSLPD